MNNGHRDKDFFYFLFYLKRLKPKDWNLVNGDCSRGNLVIKWGDFGFSIRSKTKSTQNSKVTKINIQIEDNVKNLKDRIIGREKERKSTCI